MSTFYINLKINEFKKVMDNDFNLSGDLSFTYKNTTYYLEKGMAALYRLKEMLGETRASKKSKYKYVIYATSEEEALINAIWRAYEEKNNVMVYSRLKFCQDDGVDIKEVSTDATTLYDGLYPLHSALYQKRLIGDFPDSKIASDTEDDDSDTNDTGQVTLTGDTDINGNSIEIVTVADKGDLDPTAHLLNFGSVPTDDKTPSRFDNSPHKAPAKR